MWQYNNKQLWQIRKENTTHMAFLSRCFYKALTKCVFQSKLNIYDGGFSKKY